ncbi:MAG: bestrophin family ion channel [Cyanobacteria bacterium P01_G01_bin.39]
MALSNKKNVRRKKHSLKWLWKASIIPEVLPVVLCYGFISLAVVVLYQSGINVAFSTIGLAIPAVVLGLLLVFRTNTAYDRFWEARKLWGSQINTTRSLAQSIWTLVPTIDQVHAQEKQQISQLLPAFAVATKLYLRSEPIDQELINLLSPQQYKLLCQQAHPPLTILGWLRVWVKQQFQHNYIGDREYIYLFELIDILNADLGAYERILNTPMPLAYSLHLRHLIYLYCLLFPFQVVDSLQWLTIPATCLVAFALFGIEEIGVEIQNPFGYDENDLELNRYCQIIQNNVAEIMTTAKEGQN